ncbi:MAG TPA: bifunctional alpha,alpha-trehalose-phosphate synthase (UDP-forming)/trehalose-phosphatase [Bdellovibrionales bacterium]|nr:bifunctional alpha,alpha-trehalose-phosphate synthase (UDP-forming)/trehalose-phosphatase [Bdellovibrionales bacterium]
MSRWVTVANRLPFTLSPDGEQITTSTGGLVSALSGVHAAAEKIWIGCAPDHLTPENWKSVQAKIPGDSSWSYRPIFVDKALYDSYYNRTGNDVLWPLLHYQPELVSFDKSSWEDYKTVNEKFAEAIAQEAQDDDLIWIHDFHLFMVPKFLRKLRPKLKIGFFLHVPFPTSEVFRQLPVREQILDSLLECDLVGFHDYSYLQHFGSSLLRLLGVEPQFTSVTRDGRTTRFGVFPVSIDTEKFMRRARDPKIHALAQNIKEQGFLFLGVDRLDYIKGLDLKLKAFRTFLKKYPHVREQVSLLQIAVPTRGDVPVYCQLARDIAQLIGEINGEFSTPNWTPVRYIHASVSFDDLMALYRSADALLVTSKRDGMNLVALEYLASQTVEKPGVVLLSEFAGAASALSHTLPINPWDLEDSARKMLQALEMTREEKVFRLRMMQDFLREYTATDWAAAFIAELAKEMPAENLKGPARIEPNQDAVDLLCDRVLASKPERIALLLDYDGTLTPIRSRPEEAVMSQEERDAILELSRYPWIDLVIVSGRDSKFMASQFFGINAHLAAEHGAKVFSPGLRKWRRRVLRTRSTWYPAAEKIMSDYAARVPHSRVEKKQYSIAWHYRLAPQEFADFQARKLVEELEVGLSNLPVNVLRGKKVVELRAMEADKGVFARTFLEDASPNTFALALGDDSTDEDMFRAIKGRGISFKIGAGSSAADIAIHSQSLVIDFLRSLGRALDQRMQRFEPEMHVETRPTHSARFETASLD